MTYTELATIITESAQIGMMETIVRAYESELYPLLESSKPVKAITGIRRSGKSFLLKKMYRYLIDQKKIPQNNVYRRVQ